MLNALGPGKLAGRFRKVGVEAIFPDRSQPTLAMALGGVGLTLRDIATLYTALARGGDVTPLIYRKSDLKQSAEALIHGKQAERKRLMSPLAAWYVTDILKDAPPPLNAKAGRLAYKTGTSYGYRDAWAVGYDGRHVVAVWVGRPDGAATPGLSGRVAAAPILFDAFARLGERRSALQSAPAGALRVTGSELPPPLKRFRENGVEAVQGPFLEPRVAISYPPDRAEVELEADDPVLLKANGGVLPLTRDILLGGRHFSGADVFTGLRQLLQQRREIDTLWREIDVLVVPTTPTIYRIEEMLADPLVLNARLGTYTSFVNFADLAGIAVPNGFLPNGLPQGVTLLAPAWSEPALTRLADRFHRARGVPLGATGAAHPDIPITEKESA